MRNIVLILFITTLILFGCMQVAEKPTGMAKAKEEKAPKPDETQQTNQPMAQPIEKQRNITNLTRVEGQSNATNQKTIAPQIQMIRLTTDIGEIQAFYFHPSPDKKLPAVIYNHGLFVEQYGYEGAAAKGYDVKDFVKAIGDLGYAAIAPIRPETNNPAPIDSSLEFLQKQENIDTGKIAMIGFSKGGVFTIKKAIEPPGSAPLRGIVLLAPAITGDPIKFQIFQGLDRIVIPVYIGLGRNEPNPTLAKNVNELILKLIALKKDVRYKNNYQGDHKWFYKVQDEYWNEVNVFLQDIFAAKS